MSGFTIFMRLVLACILGGIIGLEREKRKRAAGLRTHILVCMGSSLIMMVSIFMFEKFKGSTVIDPGRIAAGVITGIGFLGAGTIIRSAQSVRGLTTAATIWVSAGIGLATGCGFYSAAIWAALFSLLALILLRRIENKLSKDNSASSDREN